MFILSNKQQRLMLTLLMAVVLVSVFALSAQADLRTVGTFTPQQVDYHTGTTSNTQFNEVSTIRALSSSSVDGGERGWARFDVSGIPAGSTINSVTLFLYCTQAAFFESFDVHSLETDPVGSTAAAVFADCGDGDTYYSQNAGLLSVPQWFEMPLGADAIADLQARVDNADGWFGVGVDAPQNGDGFLFLFEGQADTNPPYIQVNYTESTAPGVATNPSPADGADNVAIDTNLSWSNGVNTVAVDVYLRANDNQFEASDKVVDNQNVSSYDPPSDLMNGTTYYWKVVSRNSTGDETEGFVWSFQTVCATVTSFSYNFDGVAAPAIPPCLTVENVNADEQGWVSQAEDPRSQPNAMVYLYNTSQAADDWFFTQPVDLTAGSTYIVDFYYRGRAGTVEKMEVQVGTSASAAGMTTQIFDNANITENTYQYGYGTYTPSSSGTYYFGFHCYSDADQGALYVDDVSFDELVAPNAAVVVSPADNGTNVSVFADLDWASGGGGPTGYRLSFGTDNPPTNILNDSDLGNVTVYDPGQLAYNTTYYWEVVPYNAAGDGAASVWSFTTEPDPTVTSYPYTQNFDNGGSIPLGWTNDANDSGEDWRFDMTLPENYNPNADHTGGGYFAWADDSSPHATAINLISPPFDLSGVNNTTMTFWYFNSKQTNPSMLHIDVSTDGGANWTESVASFGYGGTDWVLQTVDLSAYDGVSRAFLRYRVVETDDFDSDIAIDDVYVGEQPVPLCATLVSPTDTGTDVSVISTLNWADGGGATGYRVYFDTVNPPQNLVYSGTNTTYDPALDFGNTYYWKVVAYNAAGDAQNCDIWSFSTAPGPLSGNYTVGNGGDFSTMSAAVAALNDRGVSGAVTMELTDNSYPSDTSPMMIGVVNGTSALNTVTIRAATNINPTFNITGDYGFQLNGSDYVTLDGLTIAVTGQHAVHILGSASNAATYNAVKNCTLSTGAASNSRGVYLEGDSSNPNMSNTVEGNTIENFGAAGIRAAYEQSLVLRGNTIRNASNGNFTTSGIRFTAGVQNAEVSANRIYTLSATTNSNVYGLWLANSQNNSYVNNMISDLNVTGTGNVRGIFLENNGTNSSFYFNSVYLTGTQSNSQSTTAFFTSSANGTPSLIVKNNIFVNMRESDAGGSHYAIQVANGGTMTQFADINYNDLYVSNNNGMGHVGYGKPSGQPEQNLTLLSDWQAALASRGITGADANSISGDPGFTSTTNLKLTSVSSPAVSAGVAISGITTDQEGTERPDPPSIGADDFRNDPPVWTPVPDQTFSEDGSPTPAPTINLATYASDPNSSEGDAIVSWDAEVVGGGTDLTVSVDGTGMASFSVASNWFGTKQVIFTATDTRHSSASDQIQVTVESVNDIPVFDTPVPDQSFDEDTTPAAIDLRQYVSDVETADDQLTWQVSSNMTELVPSVSATGSLTFTTEQDWYGTATVTVTVTDADNGSENDAFTVTVNPVNDAPVALDSYVLIVPYQGFADVTLADLAEDVDNTDAELSWTVLVPNDSINVTDNGTTFRFSHIGVSYGTYPVTLQVEDPEPLTDDLTITVIIPDPSNNPPQWSATFTAVNFNEDETPAPTVDLTQQVTDDLTPANQLIYLSEVIGGGTDLTVSIASGVATFNAAANWYGNKQVKFIAIDQLGGADTTTVTVTVNPVNDQPVFDTALPDVTFSEDGSPTPSPVIDLKSYVSDIETADANLTWSSSYTVVTLREDGSRSVSSVTKALTDVKAQQTLRVGELTVNITTDGVLSFTPAADWNGVANVTITATDEGGLSVSDDMQVTVENVNDAPVLGALDAQLTLTLSTPYDIALTSTDADNDTPTYTVDDITGFGSGFATIVGGNTLHFDPTTLGSGQVTVSVSDGNGGSDSHTFDVTVNYADPQIETRYETTNQNDDATASYTFQICTASGGDLVGFAAADAIVDVSYYATPNDQQILTDFASVSINMASSSCAEVTVSYDLSDSRLPDAGGITLSTTLQFVGSNIGQPLSTSLRINVLPTLSPQILALLGNLSGLTLNDIWPIADFNGDTCVEAFDLLVLLYAYGSANGDVHWNPAVDVALDGIFDQIGHDDAVNFADLARFAVYYGQGQCASARIASELDQLEGLFVSARDQKAASQTITSGVTAFTPVVGAETVHVGETFDVALTAQNVVDLFAGSITVGYTADVLELKSVAAGDLFAANGINAIFPDAMMQHTSGQVVVDVASLDGTGVMGSGTLATLTFEVKAAGEWNIQVDNVIALDTNLNAFENIQIFESKGSAKAQIAVPANYELYANYPNPFNPKTTIRFDIPATANVELRIYDVSGRLVNALVSETLEAGTYSVEWDGTNAKGEAVSSGVYFYQLHSEDFSATQSMILLK